MPGIWRSIYAASNEVRNNVRTQVGPTQPTGALRGTRAWIPWTIAGLAVAALLAVVVWPTSHARP